MGGCDTTVRTLFDCDCECKDYLGVWTSHSIIPKSGKLLKEEVAAGKKWMAELAKAMKKGQYFAMAQTERAEGGGLWDYDPCQALGFELVVVTELPKKLRKGHGPAAKGNKNINATSIASLLRRKVPVWWCKVMCLSYSAATKLWTPHAGGKYSNHPVLLEQLCHDLPSADLEEYITQTDSRNKFVNAKLSDDGIRFVIRYGNLSHYGRARLEDEDEEESSEGVGD